MGVQFSLYINCRKWKVESVKDRSGEAIDCDLSNRAKPDPASRARSLAQVDRQCIYSISCRFYSVELLNAYVTHSTCNSLLLNTSISTGKQTDLGLDCWISLNHVGSCSGSRLTGARDTSQKCHSHTLIRIPSNRRSLMCNNVATTLLVPSGCAPLLCVTAKLYPPR